MLERYVAAAGAQLLEVGEGLIELHVPADDQKDFQNRSSIRIAFTLDALEGDPDAEIAVVGSPLVEQLINAIRSRGSRLSHGFVRPQAGPSAERAELRIPVTNGSVGVARVDVARHRVVRLLARVVVSAGSAVEEHLIESGYFDATTGIAVPADVAAQCLAHGGAAKSAKTDVPLEASRSGAELVEIALADLRARFESKVHQLRADAEQALESELQRIDSYYASLLADGGGKASDVADATARRAFEAEHARRRAEEERRHRVRVVVHPVQLTEWEMLVQCAQWEITSVDERYKGRLVAERWLNGRGSWVLACPGCGASNPAALSVCKSGHVGCDACSLTCGVCADVSCREHGMSACHVDGQPACGEHARTCASCNEACCTTHEAICADGNHSACTTCIAPCALCGGQVCAAHATMTKESAPRGIRRLCANCACVCEGGTHEAVGRDEVTRCSSCEKYVCENHQSICAVDQRVHCSKHVRRTDGSRRLVCAEHRNECAFEPGVVLASDELGQCTSCGRVACEHHCHPCVEDGRPYCHDHALVLRNEPGAYVCTSHATICHVDQAVLRAGVTAECPVCGRDTCKAHTRSCQWCGRAVCVADIEGRQNRCRTCSSLTVTTDPPDSVIAAATALLGSRQRPREWKTARDASHTVVEVDLGWRRRMVFAVRHGDTVAKAGRSHSVTGTRVVAVRR